MTSSRTPPPRPLHPLGQSTIYRFHSQSARHSRTPSRPIRIHCQQDSSFRGRHRRETEVFAPEVRQGTLDVVRAEPRSNCGTRVRVSETPSPNICLANFTRLSPLCGQLRFPTTSFAVMCSTRRMRSSFL